MTLVLYQFPISHYCEKIRWVLDYKGLEYQIKNLLPGLHAKTTMKLAEKSSVPLLSHDGRCVQGSQKIITYLDEQFPKKKLTPVNPQEAQAAMEWERFLDNEIGINLRCFMYHNLLHRRQPVLGFFATDGPFWAKPFLWFAFPKLAKAMRRFMKIDATTSVRSYQRLRKALERLNASLAGNQYLTGNRFSRADLTAAALLAPLFMPPQYGLRWPQQYPQPLQSEIDALAPLLQWAKEIYQKHR